MRRAPPPGDTLVTGPRLAWPGEKDDRDPIAACESAAERPLRTVVHLVCNRYAVCDAVGGAPSRCAFARRWGATSARVGDLCRPSDELECGPAGRCIERRDRGVRGVRCWAQSDSNVGGTRPGGGPRFLCDLDVWSGFGGEVFEPEAYCRPAVPMGGVCVPYTVTCDGPRTFCTPGNVDAQGRIFICTCVAT